MKLNYKSLLFAAAVAAGASALSSCDNEKVFDLNYQEANVIGEITLPWGAEITLPVGGELELNPTIAPESAAGLPFLAKSSDISVASIENGKILCHSEGTAYITVTPEVGFGATATLTVNVVDHVVYASSLTIEGVNELNPYHYLGDEFQLKAVIEPIDHTYNYVNWSTSNPDVIQIDNDGNVVCGVPGTATVTATTRFPDVEGVTGSLTLTVSESVDVDDIVIAPVTEGLCIDLPYDLDVTYFPDYGNSATVEWTSSDETIAFVTRNSEGVHVIPSGFGTCTITGTTTSGNTASVSVTITPGWRIWDASNKWSMWAPATNGSTFNYDAVPGALKVNMFGNGGKWRADIKYSATPVDFNFKEYPVVALRTTIPPDGRNTFDFVPVTGDGDTPQCNVGQYGTGNPIVLSDGSVLIYVDWSKRSKIPTTGNISLRTCQIKVADIPMDGCPTDNYLIYWIRTFRSVEEMQAFAESEIAAGK